MSSKPSAKIGVGAKIRVKPGTVSPEFPDITCAGWTGTILEASGKKQEIKFIIEWDDATLGQMPADYLQKCEQQGLYHKMACFQSDQVESCD
ncbi:MAG: hypothetical protein O2955_16150 [Planctomycetota bacterium]|nr:hypothetical protein [Planctomycetota bacterium]MDA1214048.1 hypothetical protein [Planctomycetota bacterium]